MSQTAAVRAFLQTELARLDAWLDPPLSLTLDHTSVLRDLLREAIGEFEEAKTEKAEEAIVCLLAWTQRALDCAETSPAKRQEHEVHRAALLELRRTLVRGKRDDKEEEEETALETGA